MCVPDTGPRRFERPAPRCGPHRFSARELFPGAGESRKRLPAAVRFIEKHRLNEIFEGEAADTGLIVQGGLYNALIQALQALGLADEFGETRIPVYVLNVSYPLIESEVLRFCEGKRAVLMIEEGQPEFIEQGLHTILARAGAHVHLEGKGMLPQAGEYTGTVIKAGVARFFKAHGPELFPQELDAPQNLRHGARRRPRPPMCARARQHFARAAPGVRSSPPSS